MGGNSILATSLSEGKSKREQNKVETWPNLIGRPFPKWKKPMSIMVLLKMAAELNSQYNGESIDAEHALGLMGFGYEAANK